MAGDAWKGLWRNVSGSLRYRLLALVLVPMLLVMPAVIAMAYLWSNEVSYRQLLMKVNTDLAVAHEAFTGSQDRFLADLTLTAESYDFRNAVDAMLSGADQHPVIEAQLARLRQQAGFDFVHLLDLDGCDALHRGGCDVAPSPFLARARAGEAAAGVEIFSAAQLRAIDPELAERAYLELIDTRRAVPTDRDAEDRAMVLHAAYPIRNAAGEVKALLEGGVLVNRNYAFVDNLRDLVYGSGSLVEGSLGTVTVFLDDVRINTNVPRHLGRPQERAVGTRVSRDVREQVLGRGEKWIDSAFVVSDWYISAYEPIVDVNGARVGMLYAGFLEAPFRAVYYEALGWLIGLFLAVTVLCVGLTVVGARSIFRPVEAMARVIRRVHREPHLRIGTLESGDEISELAYQFDAMLDKLQRQHEQLQASAEQLEGKVRRRTADLQENIDLLKRTRQQLVGKEKLAAVGELTAGIAHEINNPTAVILGNMDLLMAELGDAGEPVRREAKVIIEQVYRIRSIITNLLQYSRPADYLSQVVDVDINKVVNDTLVLVRHDLAKKTVHLKLDLRATTRVGGSPQQFQQVLVNLIVNAVNAMIGRPGRARLTLRTRNWREGVLLTVRDNGRGIDPEILPRIFDPFFTRTQGGTGLGLSVSYGILQRFGASIQVRSRPGVGTCFFVWLQKEPMVDSEGDALIESIA